MQLRQLWFLTSCQVLFKLFCFEVTESWMLLQSIAMPRTEGHSALRHTGLHSRRGLGGCLGKHWLLVVWRGQHDSDLWKTPAKTDTTQPAPEQSPCSFRLREAQGNLTPLPAPEKALQHLTLPNLADSIRLHCFGVSHVPSAGAAEMDWTTWSPLLQALRDSTSHQAHLHPG